MMHTSMFQKHIHKVKFYPSADDFTQALLVMLVTNIMSAEPSLEGPPSDDTSFWLTQLIYVGFGTKDQKQFWSDGVKLEMME